MSEQSCGMPEDCICGLCCKHGANKFECVECESARDEVSTTPQPDAVEATAEALRLAAMCHGRILLTDPPQDAWKYHGVDEAIRQALAAKESDLRNANPPLANGSRIITAEQWEEYQSLTSENERLREALSELVEALKILGSDTYILSEKTRISIAKSALSNYQKYMESELCQ